MEDQPKVSLQAQHAMLTRILKKWHKEFPRLVQSSRMTSTEAEESVRTMKAVILNLEKLMAFEEITLEMKENHFGIPTEAMLQPEFQPTTKAT